MIMKKLRINRISFYQRLIVTFVLLLALSTVIISISAYEVAVDALNKKGEVVLKNAVVQGEMLVENSFEMVEAGLISKEVAQEFIKEKLIGPMNDDGTRTLLNTVDLGDHGYFIIYDSFGNEVMHPTLEGMNVLDVVDFGEAEKFLVKEQIQAAKNGDGYVYYTWMLPYSNELGGKISYGTYFNNWDWVIVATAYEIDFTEEAKVIMEIIIIVSLITVLVISLFIVSYVKRMTTPIVSVSEGMRDVSAGIYKTIVNPNTYDEIALLVSGYNKMLEDIQKANEDIVRQDDELRYRAYHDDLTQLFNRDGLKEHVGACIEAGTQSAYLVQMDVLGLKVINSMMGYDYGDAILRLIAKYLCDEKKGAYHIGRTSSNEFSMWLVDIEKEGVDDFIYELRSGVKEYLISHNYSQPVDLYLSKAVYPEHGDDFESLYKKAAIALKEVKDNNELSIMVFEDSMKEKFENELNMGMHLSKAIKNNDIVAYYQPQINYKNEQCIGVEALARWQSQELGFVPPSVFIPVMTRLNLISEFSVYMFKYVLNDYKALQKKYNEGITISINISPSFFMEKDFIDKIGSCIEEVDIPAGKIVLELTEDVFIADMKDISMKVKELHHMGIKVSIDDFGTGYSSLNNLVNIDFDELKIDKSFVDQIIDDEKVFDMFKILCEIGEMYNYKLVAEGLETKEQLDKIKSTSLQIIQGYYFSKPEPL